MSLNSPFGSQQWPTKDNDHPYYRGLRRSYVRENRGWWLLMMRYPFNPPDWIKYPAKLRDVNQKHQAQFDFKPLFGK